ncbi:universal stress protein [Pseudomonas sp. gcc21]|uniref:universal stress protein n=1 Tax=Pseudomonas sp. gcc21 TaxID=2726989 RepID=UPI001452504B|nr:universal stress protein [Pseudomonas sp. gcc21]QJD58774.1 universal stress protein [Pseudomonas sp. gcc21]
MEFHNVLVVIDPTSESDQPSLRRAEQLAAFYPDATFTLFLCDYNSALDGGLLFATPGLEKARASLIKQHEVFLDKLAKPLREKAASVETRAVWGKRRDRHILQAAQELRADLVIKTTHHHNPIKKLLLTNTDWQLIRHCEAPLWLVKQADTLIGSICASVDPLHEADKPAALDYKLIANSDSLAKAMRAQMYIAHCYNPLPRTLVFDASIIGDYDAYAGEVRARHQQAFAELADTAGIPATHRQLLQGYPEEAIPEFIEKQAINLLVMGAVSRSRLDAALIGHTAERLLDEVPCDVLVIKPDEFVDPSRPAS